MKKQNKNNKNHIYTDMYEDDIDEVEPLDGYFTILENHEIINNPEDALKEVVGLSNQKQELLNVMHWFKNAEYYQSRGVNVPKGIILYGAPGNGKSLLMKELAKMIDVPIIIFKGGPTYNLPEGLNKAFSVARKMKKSIIMIDEIDMLVDESSGFLRSLQDNLDGLETINNVLFLCATNYIESIPAALKRNGRLDKLIEVNAPKAEDALGVLKLYFDKCKMKLPERIDENELALTLEGNSCSTIQAIVNDCALRNNFEDITKDKIYESISIITKKIIKESRPPIMDICIHEAAHCVMAYKYKNFVRVDNLNVEGNCGNCVVKKLYEPLPTVQRALAGIQIFMAGIIGQKLLNKDYCIGAEGDLENARNTAYNLINKCGYSSCWETLPNISKTSREETQYKRRKMERKIEKLLRKQEKEVYLYLRKHLEQITKLAKLLYEKKVINSKEIMECLG